MTKKAIIDTVNTAVQNDINIKIFSDDDKYGLGCNQFRELAGICLRAECYEEVELQIMYNKAKAEENKSWNNKRNGKAVADVVIGCMEKIKKDSSEKELLKQLSLMFGYFYWNARICAAKNKEEYAQNKNSGQQKNNYSGGKNYGGYKGQKRG